ncbi:carboxypeptidase regulatory-like domain-containing protein [Glaciihabitans arcticus]|uniref:alpha-amylase n=1 Tax=Glaciihabitans arcticus TaxID=2668039 RepID=A0A4Q9GU70_9MICO|nr:carboxypeptidase regulatory-like domain-containing protein [Glaciihabitans arcticus]TBN55377.1 carboxypeptidase regulatory-like domain-containing protein [Glaciihabitans arcticus]
MSRVSASSLRRVALLVLSSLVTAGLLLTGITPAAQAAPGDATLTVRVTTHTGAPFAAAAVTAQSLATGTAVGDPVIIGTPVAGTPGSYQFAGLDGGSRYTIGVRTRVANAGGTPAVQYYGGAATAEAGRPVPVASGANTLDFSLFAGALSGTVLTSAGKALAGVDVTLYKVLGTSYTAVDSAVSSAKGAYAFGYLEPGIYTVRYATARAARTWVAANAGGGPVLSDTAYGTHYTVNYGKPVVLSQRLVAGGTITGVVRGSGLPLAGATVRAASLTGTPGAFTGGAVYTAHTATANAAGAFSISGLPAGYYALSIQATGDQDFADPLVAIQTAASVRVVAGKIVSAPAAMTTATPGTIILSGSITGAPATAGGTVTVGKSSDFDRTARTIDIQPNGSYSIAVAPGQYQVRIRPVNTANPAQAIVPVYRTKSVNALPAATGPVTSNWDLDPGLTFATGPIISNAATTVVGTLHQMAATTLRSTTSTISVQWYRDGMPIFGATATSFASRGSDVGAALTARVALTDTVDGLGRVVGVTAPLVVTAGPVLSAVAPASIASGTYLPGMKIVAKPQTFLQTALTYSYQWTRDGVFIPGATSVAYTLTPADGGTQIAARVRGSKAGFTTSSVSIAGPVTVGRFAAPVLKKAPSLTATTIGQPAGQIRYTVRSGTWSPVPGFGYQWFADGVEIPGATYASFVYVPDLYSGRSLTVRVQTVKLGHTAASSTLVARRGSAVPTGSGTPAVTQGAASVTAGQAVPVATVLTAVPGTWTTPDATALPTFSFVWQRQLATGVWSTIPGATSATYSVAVADVGRPLQVRVTVVSPRYSNVALQPIPAGVGLLRQDLATAAATVTIGGAGAPTLAVTATGITWPVTAVTQTYAWFSCATSCVSYPAGYTAIAKATTASYVPPAALGSKSLVVRVVASKAGFAPRTIVSEPRVLDAANLIGNTAAPGYAKGLVSGSAKVGIALTSSAAGWKIPGVTRSYIWQKCAAACATEANWAQLATGASYVPDATAFGTGGNLLRVVEIAAKKGYTTARAAATVQLSITPSVEYPTSTPTITRVGNVLTVSPVTWGPGWTAAAADDVKYAWHVGDGWAPPYEDSRTYTIKPEDSGKPIWVQISYDSGAPAYGGLAGIIRPVAIRGTAPSAQPAFTFDGTRVGDYLYFSDPSFALPAWGGEAYTRSYQWLSNGAPIPGQTDHNYLATADQLGKTISLRATLTTDRYNPVVNTSAGVVLQPGDTHYGSVSLSGNSYVGSVITATPYFPAGHTFRYQWIRDDNGVLTDIPKATAKTYTLVAADLDASIRVRVTAQRPGFTGRTEESGNIYVGIRYFQQTVPAELVGSGVAGAPLSVIPPVFAGVKPAYTYLWTRNGVVIPGATAATFTPPAAYSGDAIVAKVTARLAGWNPVTASTDARTITPGAAPTALGVNAPKVTGVAKGCSTLTATRGVWTADGAGYAYQWHASLDGPIPGATLSQFTIPTGAYIGQKLFVVVTATRTGLAVGTAQSLPTAAVLDTGC